ncbi:MAG TPA: DsrE family protein [Pyrinomonadaceae bacterium]|nr:DsrE family protein [Pyrinomonadaceae bacterium]
MSNYIFIESQDPFESRDPKFVEDMAIALKKRGHNVTVFLVQNGVLATRTESLARLTSAGVSLLADDFSLRERGIQPDEILPGVQSVALTVLVAALVQEQTKAMWH